ncbi:probable serine hydrolase [Ischnura elegans]|uniref:probable serine hydrolase n=1 Tax=Ischnura elegans TaxID=197161 RepID=UPI001ED8AC37|nr:probable serine hydrolase [Ischnura elegans]
MEGYSSSDSAEEITIPMPWGNICGKWWGPRQVKPVIALHGWQDNAGTFDKLAPHLPSTMSLLAIDLPGHGKSSHYPLGQSYFLYWDGLVVLRRIVKHFRWDKISILGHSLGGGIGFMYAGSYPDEVEHLICIDIASPVIRENESMIQGISATVDKVLDYEKKLDKALPAYTYDEALHLVMTAYRGSLTEDSCKVLMKRGLQESPDGKGYHFSRDVRVKVGGLGMLSKETVMTFASSIKCKVLNIKGRPGMSFDKEEYYHKVLSKIKESAEKLEFHEIPGTHHLHLNDPESIASIVINFLKC